MGHQLRQSRRDFLKQSVYAGTAVLACGCGKPLGQCLALSGNELGSKMRFGLVTWLWGKDWNLPTLIRKCEAAEVGGVELRTQHAHGVEANLNAQQRKDVKKRFRDSKVTLLGPGCNFAFHHVDQAKLKQEIEGAKQYVILSHDVGGSGVKVKPNALPKGVPVEKTIEQIGKSLNELGRFAANYGQQIRVEAHGAKTNELPIIKRIFDVATHPNVALCWNCNNVDTNGKGLEYNFNLVKDRFGATCHIHSLKDSKYPYQQFINLMVKMDYEGWLLLEGAPEPGDKVKAMAEQQKIMQKMIAQARIQLKK